MLRNPFWAPGNTVEVQKTHHFIRLEGGTVWHITGSHGSCERDCDVKPNLSNRLQDIILAFRWQNVQCQRKGVDVSTLFLVCALRPLPGTEVVSNLLLQFVHRQRLDKNRRGTARDCLF